MIALRFAHHFLTGEPIDRDTRRARLLAARCKPIGSVTRRGILSGRWDQGNVVGAFRGGRGTFHVDEPENRVPLARRAGERHALPGYGPIAGTALHIDQFTSRPENRSI